MKYFAALIGLAILFVLPQARAQNPDDDYIAIYTTIQNADSLQASGQPAQALAKYKEAASQLEKFERIFPGWNPTIVNYRKTYLADKIKGLMATVPQPTNAPPAGISETNASSADLATQVSALQSQVHNLQTDNAALQSKLQEALQAQPVTSSTQAVAKAQAQIDSLLKENELLRTSLTQQVQTAATGTESATVQQLRQSLAMVKKDLADETKRADKLVAENRTLQARLQNTLTGPKDLQALREENAALKKRLATLESSGTSGAATELAKARARIAALESDMNIVRLENAALEKRLQQMQPASATNAAASIPTADEGDSADELQDTNATEMEAQHFATTPPDDDTNVSKSISQLPEGSEPLVTEAQAYFAAHQYDKAEEDYQKILKMAPNNPLVLANLAAIEMEQNKLGDAEKHLKAALAQSPDDAYDLATYGYLKFRQQKYDEALDALSHAAKLDPQNPQIQNYLGVTLSHKGLTAEAETALRKAIELDPNYAAAHNNLAVVYINENPPMAELARWHYQKALEGGQPRNPELEKLLAQKGAPVNPQ